VPLVAAGAGGKPSASYEPKQVAGDAGGQAANPARAAAPKVETAGSDVGGDPEVAAAARRRGARAKKAAPKVPESRENPQSTVTAPPSSPTVARINPEPTDETGIK
jgi:hypothetical protein